MQLPKGKTLYDLLEIDKKQVDEDESIIKKAYRRLALKYHPDKQSSNSCTPQDLDNATQSFQLVGFAYTILNDPSKRKHYDLTGSLDGEDSFLSGDKDWTDFFKELWQGVVSSETIEAHSLKYKGSKEEEEDLLKYYTQLNGNMNHILAHVEHSKATDVPRFMEIINAAIKDNKVTSYPAYDKTTTKSAQLRRIKREEKETAEAEKLVAGNKDKKTNNDGKGKKRMEESENSCNDDNKDDGDGDDLDSLREMMKARQEQRKNQMDAMLASMEEKATKQSTESNSNKRGKGNQRKRQRGADDDDSTSKSSSDSTRKSAKSAQ